MHFHQHTWMSMEELGSRFPEYAPTYEYAGELIDSYQRELAAGPLKDGVLVQVRNRAWFNRPIHGYLRRADALKLYELAYFAPGDILELGSFQGLSACILSQANRNSPHPKWVISVDKSALRVLQTLLTLQTMGLRRGVTVIRSEAAAAVRRLAAAGRRFSLVFIDHSHAYGPVLAVCRELQSVVPPGGFCLFHDFNDPRNRDARDEDYNVYAAVLDGLPADAFEFCGIYGCSALYRAI